MVSRLGFEPRTLALKGLGMYLEDKLKVKVKSPSCPGLTLLTRDDTNLLRRLADEERKR